MRSSPGDVRSGTLSHRIDGIDTLRLIAAVWVALGHGASLPVEAWIGRTSGLHLLAIGFSKMLFNGTDAVVVFFVISGICIQAPYDAGANPNPLSFWLRRGTRIGVPLLVVLLALQFAGPDAREAVGGVLWTLYCELVYYALYPVLLMLARRFSWGAVLAGASVASAVVAASHPAALRLWELGPLTFIFCYPAWIMGAMMVQRIQVPNRDATAPWLMRGAAVLHGLAAAILLTHLPIQIGLIWTVPPLVLLCWWWIPRELALRALRPIIVLEACGVASYSLYLTHQFANSYFNVSPVGGPLLNWSARIGCIAVLAGIAYFLVERPSHNLARQFRRRVGAPIRSRPVPVD